MEDILVPLAFFGIIPFIVWAVSSYRHKSYLATADILKTMVERGETPSTDLIKSLGVQPKKRHGDLRVGVILISLAISFFLLGGAIPDDEAPAILQSLATFPLLVGLAYTGLWFAYGRKEG